MKQINTIMIRCIAVMVILLSTNLSTFSQVLDWANKIGTTGNNRAVNLIQDNAGNIYSTGFFEGTVDFDPSASTFNLTSAGGADVYVMKQDANGNFVWAFSIACTGTNDLPSGITLDASNNILLAGSFSGTADFDPSASTFNLSYHNPSGFGAKYDSDGNFIWAGHMISGGGVSANCIAVDGSSAVYIAGSFSETPDFDPGAGVFNISNAGSTFSGDAFITKWDVNGAFVWAKSFRSFDDARIQGITIDGTGNIYTTGSFSGFTDFDPGAGSSFINNNTGSDAFISKLDNNGDFVWIKQLGGTAAAGSADIELDASGNVYTIGNFGGTADADPNAGIQSIVSNGLNDVFVQKLDAAGNLIWATSVGGTGQDAPIAIDVNTTGKIFTTGYFQNTVDFDPTAGTTNLTATGTYTAFVQRLTDAGAFDWAVSVGGTGNEFGRDVIGDANDAAIVVGQFQNTVDFDPTAGTTNFTAAGTYDGFIAKYQDVPMGTALDFDGSNDHVNAMTGFTEQSFTVEMWVNPAATQSNLANIIDNSHSGAQNWVLQQNFANTNQYWFFTPTSPDIFFSIPANTWSHVVLVHENTTNGKKVYVNGVLQAEVTPTGNIPYNATNLYLGNWAAGGRPWNGQMDEVRIWNYARCQAEIIGQKDCELTGSETGLVVYYNFNQGIEDGNNPTETTLLDRTANGNNGTLVSFGLTAGGTSNWTDGTANGVSGTCVAIALPEARLVGNSIEITTGANSPTTTNDTDFEDVCSASPVTKTFTLENTGTGDLTISTINSSNPAFSISNTPLTTITSGNSTTIDVTFTPTANSTVTSTITISNNDCDEAAYTFVVQGTGILSPTDQTVVASQATVCPGQATTIDVGSSDVGVNYYLRDDADDAVIAGPLAGTGAGLSFNPGTVAQTTTYNVYAEGTSTALNFNANQYINSNGLPTFANNFTIEAWVNPTSTHGIDGQSTSGTGGTSGQKYMLWPTHRGSQAGVGISVGTNGISVYEHGGGYMPSLLTWANPVSGWTHIAVVYTNKQPSLYVNGVLVATGLTSTKSNCYPSLGRANVIYPNSGGIGGGSYGSFDGSIDDFRLWSVSRTATEIQNNMNTCLTGTEPNLYALYDFENGTGSTSLTDLTGNADNQGTLTNMDANTDWVAGASVCSTCPREMTQTATVTLDAGTAVGNDKRGEMYTFSGADDYIQVGNMGAVNDWTIETWFKPTGWNNYENIFHTAFPASSNTNAGVRLEMSNNYFAGNLYVGVSATNTWSPSTIIPLGGGVPVNEWHHIAIVGDNTNDRLYVYLNGEKVVDRVYTNWPTGFGNLVVGRGFGYIADRDFSGSLDEFRVWSTARTQAEVRENMHLSISDCQSGLMAYYQFDNDDPIGTVNGVKDATGTYNATAINMTAANRVDSEVAVGKGFSDRVTITGAGIVNFPYTRVNMTFGASHPNGEVVVTRITTEKPHGWSSTGLDIDNEYFVVHNYGTNTFTALSDITFNNLGYVDPADAASPNVFSLFKRGSNDFGATWGTALGNAVSATAGGSGSVSFDNTTNITSFSQFVIGTPVAQASDLPVELLSFNAKRKDAGTVKLTWATATELNNKGFYIERMLAVEQVFETVGFVEGKGTTTAMSYYDLEDENAYIGTTYYRLRQVDFDGTTTYSDVRAVNGQGIENNSTINLYPNPVSNQLNVRFERLPSTDQTATITVVNATGQVLIQYETGVNEYQTLSIEGVENLVPALYFLKIDIQDGQEWIQKFIKKEP